MNLSLGLPTLASEHGGRIDLILILAHVFIAVLFLGWLAYGIYVLVRFRQSKHASAAYRGAQTNAAYYIEAGVIVVEVILLVALSIPVWSGRLAAAASSDPNIVRLRVIAQQYAWNIHYPGKDGVYGKTSQSLVDDVTNPVGLDRTDEHSGDDVVTRNQLYLPVNRPVVVQLSSKDVVHSFGLPEFRVKQDAIPGLTTQAAFTPILTTAEFRTEKGEPIRTFEIVCSQLCGIGHASMRGFVTVVTDDEFQAWIEKTSAEQKASDDDIFAL